jgi:EAL domain-containing protein (putative c-di-GMP-specific phosphodiesterase class I)
MTRAERQYATRARRRGVSSKWICAWRSRITEFELHYQPLVSLQTNEITAFE